MKLKRILATLAAASLAATGMATSAFAADVVDFEDGSYAGIEMLIEAGADNSILSVVDFNGSKALKVDVQDVTMIPKVKFLVTELVGIENVDKVDKITFDLTIESKDGATPPGWGGGAVGAGGTNTGWTQEDWEASEYTNPITATVTVQRDFLVAAEGFPAGEEDAHFLLQRWGQAADTGVPYNMYIDNVKFVDASGNAIAIVAATTTPDTTPDTTTPDTTPADGDSNVDTGVAPVAALAVVALAGAALVATKKR